MYGLVGRNTVVVGAMVTAVLLIMQLRTSGVHGYAPADVLSILLIAVPVMTRAVRPPPRRRSRTTGAEAGDHGRYDRPQPSRPDTEAARAVERMVVRGIALVIAFGAWLLAVVLVLLQAWAPAVSALIVFGVAVTGVEAQAEETPVAASRGNGAG